MWLHGIIRWTAVYLVRLEADGGEPSGDNRVFLRVAVPLRILGYAIYSPALPAQGCGTVFFVGVHATSAVSHVRPCRHCIPPLKVAAERFGCEERGRDREQ